MRLQESNVAVSTSPVSDEVGDLSQLLPPPTPEGRINSLTGLRMLAAGAVFTNHLLPPLSFPHWISVYFSSGYAGVTLFFVLSGFVLAWNYGESLGDHMSGDALWSFFVARFARIYPVYLFALIFVVAPMYYNGTKLPFIWYHIFAVQTWSGNAANALGYNGPGWSVGIELFLYACFPLLALAFRHIRRDYRALIAAGVVSIGFAAAMLAWAVLTGHKTLPTTAPDSTYRWLYRTPWTRLGDFALGMTAAYLVMLVPRDLSKWWGRAAQFVGLGSILVLMGSTRVLLTPASWDFAYMLPIFLLIFGLALTPSTGLARWLSTKTMLLLGEASFAFYLFHRVLLGYLPVTTSLHTSDWVFSTAVNFAFILCVAVGVHVLVERPSRRFVRRALDPASRKMSQPA